MCTISREEVAWRLGASGRKWRGGAEKRKKLRVAVWHEKLEMPRARARVSRTGKLSGFTTPTSRASVPYKASWVWAGAVAKYLLRPRASFSSPRPAPRSCRNRRERNGRCAAGKSTFIRLYRRSGKLALAPMNLRRARVAGRSYSAGAQSLKHVWTVGTCGKKNSAWASGAPAGGRRVAACLGRWRALPQRAARREVQKPKPP